jgi:signal transduction histidine kinase
VHRDKDEIEKQISNLIRELRAVAMEDSRITMEEQALMDKIEEDAHQMQNQIIQVLESDLDDNEFADLVNDFLQDIISNAIKFAKADWVISEDEMRLIGKLLEFTDKGGEF